MNATVKEKLHCDTIQFSPIILYAVACPIFIQAIGTDITFFGYHRIWIYLRLGIIPFTFMALSFLRVPRIKKHLPSLPINLVSYYMAGVLFAICAATGFEQSPHYHSIIQLLIAYAIFPLGWAGFLSGVLPISVGYLLLCLSHQDFDFTIFSHQNLLFFRSYFAISIVAFFISHRIRVNYYKSSLSLQQEIKDRESIIGEQVKSITAAREAIAISQMTQMIAHDVRKPFSMIRVILDYLREAKTIDDAREIAAAGIPEIQHGLDTVNGLLQDVMEIGAKKSELVTEYAKPEALIENSIREALRGLDRADVEISYNFKHDAAVIIDIHKVMRVFSNITGNAMQAMHQKGRLWFHTAMQREEGRVFVKFTVGNSGSFIAPEDLPFLFDAFYTKNKKGGTGLGLAIAKKVVLAHSGQIWCESSESTGVEFHFTLPAAPNSTYAPDIASLPQNSREVLASMRNFLQLSNAPVKELDHNESQWEDDLLQLLKKVSAKMRIQIIDDESVYRTALISYLKQQQTIFSHLEIVADVNAEEALYSATHGVFDFTIVDVDLGAGSIGGFELVRKLRALGQHGFICIHSNHFLYTDYKEAITHGADGFMPKPMSRAQLLKLLSQALSKALANETTKTVQAEQTAAHTSLFALIDESKIARISLQYAWALGILKTFESPTMFWRYAAAHSEFLGELTGIVMDYYFVEDNGQNAADFARELKARAPHMPIVLSSNVDIDEIEFDRELFVGRFNKEIPAQEDIAHAFGLDG